MTKLLALTKPPSEMNGPELLAYLDVLDADASNRIAAYQNERSVAEASGCVDSLRRLDERFAEYQGFLNDHATLRERVREDFAHDF